MCHDITLDAFLDAGNPNAFPEAGLPWTPDKLYGVAQIDDGAWDDLASEFTAAGFNIERSVTRTRGPGPETATVALDVRLNSEHQRKALRAHRTQIPEDNFLISLPPDLRELAFATAYFIRIFPPCYQGEKEPDLLHGLN